MDKLGQALEALELTENQQITYKTLLETGKGSAQALAHKTGIKRTTMYSLLDELEKMGLISVIPNSSKKIYRPLSPEVLFNRFEEKMSAIRDALPEIQAMLRKRGVEEKPRVLYFRGVDGIKQVATYDMGNLNNEQITGFSSNVESDTLKMFGDFFYKLNKKVRKQNTTKEGIIPDQSEDADVEEIYKHDDFPNVKQILVPQSEFDPRVAFDVTDRWVKIYDFDNLQGLVIESRAVAQAMQQIYKLAKRGAEEIRLTGQK